MDALAERLLSKVKTGRGCWEWLASKRSGYGALKVKGKLVGAHRLSYTLFRGDPGKLFVLHSCDNPACVRPSHLFLGTNSINMKDAYVKGRIKPKPPGSAVLKPEQVKAIRKREHERAVDLAEEFGVHRNTIYDILSGKTWPDL